MGNRHEFLYEVLRRDRWLTLSSSTAVAKAVAAANKAALVR
jgi:hypothetical protein